MYVNKNDEEKFIIFLFWSFFCINFLRIFVDCYIFKRCEREKLMKVLFGYWVERIVCFIVFNFS